VTFVQRISSQSKPGDAAARRVIVQELESFLRTSRLRRVHFADGSVAPPSMAYVTNFPRLSIPLHGDHSMELARNGRSLGVRVSRGQAVFVPPNAWNRPDWDRPVEVLTFLFGANQIGVSLVRHTKGSALGAGTLKSSIHAVHDGVTQSVLTALITSANEKSGGPLTRLLTESLLHSCLRLLRSPEAHRSRKAVRTYETLCLYVQENFQAPLSRQSLAQRFGLAPSHVSRLFRREGLMHFNDYLNLVRVNRAKFILRNYSVALKEVAANCGYNDVAYFCRVFKRISEVTPTQYRNRDSDESQAAPPPPLRRGI
jgi:AraC-like DNA-binding protein